MKVRWILPLALTAACAQGEFVGPGAGDPPGPGPTEPPPPAFETPALTGAVAGESSVRVDWRIPGEGVEVGIFVASSRASLLDRAPLLETDAGGGAVFGGLPADTEHFVGLGARRAGESAYEQVGASVRVRTASPIYVDPAADLAVADGKTPATAFPDLLRGLLTAFGQGGGNVFALGGDYATSSLPVFGGVHLYGGFAPGFALGERDTEGRRTTLSAATNLPVLDVRGGGEAVVLDGFALLGGSLATVGIDVDATSVEVRGVEVRECSGRGMRLRNGDSGDPLELLVVGSEFTRNAADGVSLQGAFDVRIIGSSFSANVQEGVDLDDLIAPDGRRVTLEITDSSFAGNGTQGLDVDLAAPATPGPNGGRFEIVVMGSRFERNGEEGALVDFDFEFAPAWEADVAIVGCLARGNLGAGVHVDADARGPILVHRLLSSSNGAEGLWVSSESTGGLAVVSASALTGNVGPGLRASFGNRVVAAAHCLFAGNGGGGFRSEVTESTATSCLAFVQPAAWSGVRTEASLDLSGPPSGLFLRAPESYAFAESVEEERVVLASDPQAGPGDLVEVADDGTPRTVVAVAGRAVTIDPPLEDLRLPSLVSVFEPGDTVEEDYRLAPASPALGAGMTPPGGPIVDAGIWGSPAAGLPGLSGVGDPGLFVVASTVPLLHEVLGRDDVIRIGFGGGAPSSASLGLDTVRAVTHSGTELPIDVFLDGGELMIAPPPAGWGPEGTSLEVHAALRSEAGTALTAPLTLSYSP